MRVHSAGSTPPHLLHCSLSMYLRLPLIYCSATRGCIHAHGLLCHSAGLTLNSNCSRDWLTLLSMPGGPSCAPHQTGEHGQELLLMLLISQGCLLQHITYDNWPHWSWSDPPHWYPSGPVGSSHLPRRV